MRVQVTIYRHIPVYLVILLRFSQNSAQSNLSTCRAYGATKMNAHSSRSHVLVMLTVTKRVVLEDGASTASGLKARVGKLYLVDLAGSERLKKSLSTGAQ